MKVPETSGDYKQANGTIGTGSIINGDPLKNPAVDFLETKTPD